MNIRVVQVGLGPIGAAIAAQVAARRGFQLAGAVDIDPSLVGRDAGELIGLGRRLRVKVTSDITRTIRSARPDVAVLSTSSSLADALPHLEQAVRCRVPVVTTTEEAAYPTPRTRRLAGRLDEAARRARVAVLGTGVNPGFLMDALPITLSALCERVDRIEVRRVQDARTRRLPFQRKIGAGLTPDEFQRQVDRGRVRHVGFTESMRMIADAMGWRLDRITDDVAPKLARAAVASDVVEVAAGQVAGIVQQGIGYVAGEPRIVLHLEAYLGAPDPYDAVLIEGLPRIASRIDGGVHGDVATASAVVNAIPAVIVARPGLHTMRDMRLPSFYGGK